MVQLQASVCVFAGHNDDSDKMYALELAESGALFPKSTHPDVEKYGSKIRVCEKFDACASNSVKNKIMDSFTKPDGAIRIVVSTVAFAMGIDVPNIRFVIHWGPPNDIESYIQETGRGGRDGRCTYTYLYYNKVDISISGHVEESMRMYCTNSTMCRRKLLMSHFSETDYIESTKLMHSCCDVCENMCSCKECGRKIFSTELDVPLQIGLSDEKGESSEHASNNPKKDGTLLKKKIIQIRDNIIASNPVSALVGADILSGLTKSNINKIIEKSTEIKNVEDIHELGIAYEFAKQVYEII